MELKVDPSASPVVERNVLRCIAVASACQYEIDTTKWITVGETATSGVQLTIEAIDEFEKENDVKVEERTTSSVFAVCRHLVNQNSIATIHAGEPPRSTEIDPNDWLSTDLTVWCIGTLDVALAGINATSIASALDYLVKILQNSSRSKDDKFLVPGKHLSIGDIFVWTALQCSPLLKHGDEFLSTRPVLVEYLERVRTTTTIEESLKWYSHLINRTPKLMTERMGTSDCEQSCLQSQFYLTTAINYTNGAPHIGHMYESIISDVICRFYRAMGSNTYFVTGTDEHGQKIATAAEAQKKQPIELCDFYVEKFKFLNAVLNMNYDFFVRTTSSNHKSLAQEIWKRSVSAGDIYLGKYCGWYNVREETFVTDREAETTDFKDPVTGVGLQRMEEMSYFFRMSKYHQPLLDYIEAHPEFILPDTRRNEIVARLTGQPLEDLSVSRTTFDWGIPVPNDPAHVMYVWFDALTNYLTAIRYTTDDPRASYWPASCHVIGKDIAWFHCVIWPCILMSIGAPLPKSVLAHGFVVAADGRKMSKSCGNVVDPNDLLPQFPNADSIRFYCIKAAETGRDLRFDMNALIEAHNNELADILGNMVHRVTALASKICNGVVPSEKPPAGLPPFDFESLTARVALFLTKYSTQAALEAIMSATRDTNKYLTEMAPWACTDAVLKRQICRAVLEALYILAHFLEPVIPSSAAEIFRRLGTPMSTIPRLSRWFDNLCPGTKISSGDEVLFVKRTV